MKRENWPVGDYGIRPAGKPDECFYCNVKRGEQHKAGCVIRCQTVVVRMTVEYVVDIPESWGAENLEFQRNEGSWCSDNGVRELQSLMDRVDAAGGCLCPMIEYAFVREATAEDEKQSRLFCETLPS